MTEYLGPSEEAKGKAGCSNCSREAKDAKVEAREFKLLFLEQDAALAIWRTRGHQFPSRCAAWGS
jgi:hypothetical protein